MKYKRIGYYDFSGITKPIYREYNKIGDDRFYYKDIKGKRIFIDVEKLERDLEV